MVGIKRSNEVKTHAGHLNCKRKYVLQVEYPYYAIESLWRQRHFLLQRDELGRGIMLSSSTIKNRLKGWKNILRGCGTFYNLLSPE